MEELLRLPLADLAAALRARRVSAGELAEAAISRHEVHGGRLHAYKHVDADAARAAAAAADAALAAQAPDAPPFCGIPFSVKDLYGVTGFPTFAGTARRLPGKWSRDGWLVARLRAQGAVPVGKTHTVEMAYGGVGINPHWGTPVNPWDAVTHRIPGGSSCGAGVSLHEGSALLALGSDTGGSIRIPASMTGTVGARTTRGRWPTDGVVPLSSTLDTVGGLTRSVADQVFFFGAVDPAWGDPAALLDEAGSVAAGPVRIAVPRCAIWEDTQTDVADAIHRALDELGAAGMRRSDVDGRLLDWAFELYLTGAIGGAECKAFLRRELPGWMEILHPIVGSRLAAAPDLGSEAYLSAVAEHRRLAAGAGALFEGADVLALPSAMITPPPVAGLADLDRYAEANRATLRPTSPASVLGLCAVSIPVGLDAAGMPVGLQLVAPGGWDERLLGAALAVERALGAPGERLGDPPAGGRGGAPAARPL